MRIVKLCVITLLVLEVLAIITHFDELLNYTGNIFKLFMPIFIIAVGIVWLIKKVL